MKKEDWKYELARDTLALGSIIFYLMFIARALVVPHYTFVFQLLSALIIVQILMFLIKNSEAHLARGIIAVVFTIMFYNNRNFTIFAIVALIALLISAVYLKKGKSPITKGLILGIISSGLAYYLINLL